MAIRIPTLRCFTVFGCSQAEKGRTACKAVQIHKMTTISLVIALETFVGSIEEKPFVYIRVTHKISLRFLVLWLWYKQYDLPVLGLQ
jgi:hypothetical protein